MRRWMALGLAIAWLGGAASSQELHAIPSAKLSWRAFPTGDQMAAVVPARARGGNVRGWMHMECQTEPTGRLKACQALGEGPVGYGFGDAGVALARYFRLDVDKAGVEALTGGVVNFPILFNVTAPLMNVVAGNPALFLTPDPKGQTPCPTDEAPQQTCKTHRFRWTGLPTFAEAAPFIRAAAASPTTTALICPITPEMKLTRCLQAGAADPSQVNAMGGLVSRFTAPDAAEDKTPTKGGFILVQFEWPALKHAIETSVLTTPRP